MSIHHNNALNLNVLSFRFHSNQFFSSYTVSTVEEAFTIATVYVRNDRIIDVNIDTSFVQLAPAQFTSLLTTISKTISEMIKLRECNVTVADVLAIKES